MCCGNHLKRNKVILISLLLYLFIQDIKLKSAIFVLIILSCVVAGLIIGIVLTCLMSRYDTIMIFTNLIDS